MKRIIWFGVFILLSLNYLFSKDDADIIIPKIDIKIDDIKKIELPVDIEFYKKSQIFITIPAPDMFEKISVDLEKTLPDILKEGEKHKPLDVAIILGYGLQNHFYADFSFFIKAFNPIISINYLREAKENLWFDINKRNPISKDDLNAQVLYGYKTFNLATDLMFYTYSFKFQDNSVYDLGIKKLLNVNLSPSIKFKYNNDITLNILNSFIFNDMNGELNDESINKNDFSYMLKAELIYNQIFLNKHFLTFKTGYEFNFLYDFLNSKIDQLDTSYVDYTFNSVEVGLGYSTTIKDMFSLKSRFDFLALFRDREFYWYLMPYLNVGYSLKEYFYTYIEGGANTVDKPKDAWLKKYNFVVLPVSLVPGYSWYAKTGIASFLSGWLKGNVDFEFVYNRDAFNWTLNDKYQTLYTFEKWSFIELNLYSGLSFYYREYISFGINFLHRFYERMFLTARDELSVAVKSVVPQAGLTFTLDFVANFVRLKTDGTPASNLYILNSSMEWSYKERIGIGVKGNNLLFFNENKFFPEYEDRALEILGYLRIAF